MTKILCRMAGVASVVMMATPAFATSLNIDFGSRNGAPSAVFGAAAGQVGTWNDVNVLGTTTGLLGLDGVATSANINVVAGEMDGSAGGGTGDGALLMDDNYFSSNGSTWSVTLTGLSDGSYDLYLYDPSNTAVGTGGGSANGTLFSDINGGFSGAFALNSNYLLLSGVTVSGGSLVISGFQAGTYSGLAGLQLVDTGAADVPEPATMLLVGSGLIGLYRRRRNA